MDSPRKIKRTRSGRIAPAFLLLLIGASLATSVVVVRAGDILRNHATAEAARRNAAARNNAGAEAAARAQRNAQDRLARTTQAMTAARNAQNAARAARAGVTGLGSDPNFPGVVLPTVPEGLAPGGLELATGGDARLEGVSSPSQVGNIVNIKQNQSQAFINWKTFNVGRSTTVNFDQSAGGNDIGKWIAFNNVLDPSGRPSQILGRINAGGQIYVINQNGVVFGPEGQVSARSTTISSLPINDNLVRRGLLNQTAGSVEFLFSTTPQGGFTPDAPLTASGRPGDVVMLPGSVITATTTPEGSGGRVALIGPNVVAGGTINTPSGQTILAAGLQVGLAAHIKDFPVLPGRRTDPTSVDDPSLRGLDVYVGQVGSFAGKVTNTGVINIPTGSLLMAGRDVQQLGVVDSTSSVTLNGRIDLLANFNARPNPNFNPAAVNIPTFLEGEAGRVTLGPGSVMRILPEVDNEKKTVGTRLPLKSQVNIFAQDIYFMTNAMLLAPNADVALAAGQWDPRLPTGFALSRGSIYIDRGALIDVSGSTNVRVPLASSILQVQLRGNELAVAPLQRTQSLRGVTLTIDIRRKGVFNGREWIGTPLGDASGFANILERTAQELTANAGSILIQAGGSFVLNPGAVLDVSGGYFVNEGGRVRTTRLLYQGRHLIDIANATPDRIYDGIYEGRFTKVQPKWGISRTWNSPLAPLGAYEQQEYIQGADGGQLNIVAPQMALDGELAGRVVIGPRQLRSSSSSALSELPGFSSLRLAFTKETVLIPPATGLAQAFLEQPTPPLISFGGRVRGPSAGPFQFDGSSPLPSERTLLVGFSPSFFEETGFANLSLENSEGDFVLPAGRTINVPPGGSLRVSGRNIFLLGSIRAPSGEVSFKAFNLPPFETAVYRALNIPGAPLLPPPVDLANGSIVLSSSTKLDVSGLIVDDRRTAPLNENPQPFLTRGGSIELLGFNVNIPRGSLLDVSGGVGITVRGRYQFGDGGDITIEAGQDLRSKSILGGRLNLAGELRGFSGRLGGILSIKAPFIQVGGTPLLPETTFFRPEFFSQGGFSRFNLTGIGAPMPGFDRASADPDEPTPYIPAVYIAPGTVINPSVTSLGYVPFPGKGQGLLRKQVRPLGLRAPVSLGFYSEAVRNEFFLEELLPFGDVGDVLLARGDILFGRGARIQTEPGGAVEMRGTTVTFLGSVIAPGGSVNIQGATSFPVSASEAALTAVARATVFLDSTARISTAGTTVILPDSFGRRIGKNFPGGSIRIAGNVVALAGAVLDVSGSSATVDVAPYQLGIGQQTQPPPISGLITKPFQLRTIPFRVETDGGRIDLVGGQFLFSDATLLGRAGGPTALGGTLAVSSGRFDPPGLDRRGSDINLVVTQSGFSIPANFAQLGIGRAVRDLSGATPPQLGYFVLDRFIAGGFDNLDLGLATSGGLARGGNVEFRGPITLNARGFVRMASGGILAADSSVSIAARYISIGQAFRPPRGPEDAVFEPFVQTVLGIVGQEPVAPTSGMGRIELAAELIDVGTTVFRGIGQATLRAASGDIRGNGELNIAGSLILEAGQIYPTTLSNFDIVAFDPPGGKGSILVRQLGVPRGAPLSAGGQLNLFASRIFQQGTLLAPFGSITLGYDGTDLDPSTPGINRPPNRVGGSTVPIPRSDLVELGAGSITSVAGIDLRRGVELFVPFGISPDGLTIIDARGVDITASGLPEKRITIAGDRVVTDVGSIVDLRGGGDLFATRWIPGLGGLVNLLGEPGAEWSPGATYNPGTLVTFRGLTYTSRVFIDPRAFPGQSGPRPGINAFWSLVEESYAIVPGFAGRFAPFASFNAGTNAAQLGGDPGFVSRTLRIGDQIFLDGVPGLARGSYTLLPRRYALLPGAFVVTPKSSGPLGTYSIPEGSTFTTGYRFNHFNQPKTFSGLRSLFEVAPQDVFRLRAEYDVLGLNTFLTEAAFELGINPVQRLPRDSGYLLFSGNSGLSLSGAVLSRPRSRLGRGAMIDVASFADIEIVRSGGGASGSAVLDAGTLSSWGAESLLIGGIRRPVLLGTNIEVRTSSLTLNNQGTPLEGPDITLVSRREITLAPGSILRVTGARTEPGGTYFIQGDGTAVRVSADRAARLVRSGTTPSTLPLLTIGAGTTISGSSTTLDSSYGFDLDPTALITAEALTLGAGQISILLNGPTPLTGQVVNPHLVLTGGVLERLRNVNELYLLTYLSSIDIYGPGSFGSENLEVLSFQTGEIRGFNQGGSDSVFTVRGRLEMSNPRNLAPAGPLVAPSGRLIFNALSTTFGKGTLGISQYAESIFNSSQRVAFEGEGLLRTAGNLTVNTPVVVAARGARHGFDVGGSLNVLASGGAGSVVGEIGGQLRFQAQDINLTSTILLPSGLFELVALSGDVNVNGRVDTSGRNFFFYDVERFTQGGTISIFSASGDVILGPESAISVAASPGGGDAGTVIIRAPQGQFDAQGSFLGGAGVNRRSGSFDLDAGSLTSLDVLQALLNAGGFAESRRLRVRTGNLTVSGETIVREFILSADSGNITVDGTARINAGGITGGKIALIARNNLTLQPGSVLTVAAQQFSNAGKGGEIYLEAGASTGGTSGPGVVDIQAGSLLDLSVAAYQQGATLNPNGDFRDPTSSAFRGQFRGTLHIRAPRVGANDIAINKIEGTIFEASSVLAEGYRIYTPAGGTMNNALRDLMNLDNANYITAFEGVNNSKLFGATVNAALQPILVVAPGVEIVNPTGSLTLGLANTAGSTNPNATTAADWDLSTFRYGIKQAPGVLTLRARDNVVFNNALSDGFISQTSLAATGHSRLWLAPLQTIALDGGGNLIRPINLQSWAYNITAGADLSGAAAASILYGSAIGSVLVGEFYPSVPNPSTSGGTIAIGENGLTANTIRISTTATDQGTRYEVIRTGTGFIHVNAAVDVQLRNQFATIYTAGVRIPNPENLFGINDFRLPDYPNTPGLHPAQTGLGAIQQFYGPLENFGSGLRRVAQYAMGGGNIVIDAGRNVGHYTLVGTNVVLDSSRQMPTNWLYRRGYVETDTGRFGEIIISSSSINDPSASTTWWIDYSNFFQGVGALGGGNVFVRAGNNVENLDAFAPTNARMSGRDASLVNIAPDANLLLELGGGDVTIVAGQDISGGVYYVERGLGTLRAGGEITTNAERSPSRGRLVTGMPEVTDPSNWLPTTLFLGKGRFDVSASGDVLLGQVANTFLMPQGLQNKFWYRGYFQTYAPDATVTVQSDQGNVTHRMAVRSQGGAVLPPLQLWYATQNQIIIGSDANASYYQPWLRLSESDVGAFELVKTLMPPRLFTTAVLGDVNLQGNMNLFPSPMGTLEVVAGGAVNGLVEIGPVGTTGRAFTSATINLSDASPSTFYGVTSPLALFNLTQTLSGLRSPNSSIYDPFRAALTESGSFTGSQASIGAKGPRHDPSILHRNSTEPLRIYARGGDISGFTLFSGKQSQIVADRDITDVAFYIQNPTAQSISLVSAGRDIIPFNEGSPLRVAALQPGNLLLNAANPRIDGSLSNAMAGDLQISGPGVFEVLAGRNIDLGSGERFTDGTGAGITSIGRLRNPFLPFEGARLVVLAGVGGREGGAALGLRGSSLDFDAFIAQYLPQGNATTDDLSEETKRLLRQFSQLSQELQAVLALDVFFALLRASSREAAETGSYASGFQAITTLFADGTYSGDIFTRLRDVRTLTGGGIAIGAPGGAMTMASTLRTFTLTPPGVVTEFGGPVEVFLDGSLDIGATRIFTLRGGDLTIWSSTGDIAAGTAAKTVVTAPPTRVTVDATTGEVLTDLGGLATGGGIGVLAAVAGVKPGSVFLIAPGGTIDAGDAGIRATGDITLAATAVVNADNIASGGATAGAPSAPAASAPNVGGLAAGSSQAAASSAAASEVGQQTQQQTSEVEEPPSVYTVEVIGYGGGEGQATDGEDIDDSPAPAIGTPTEPGREF